MCSKMPRNLKVKIKQMMYDKKRMNKTIGNVKKSFDEVNTILNSKKRG